MNKKGDLSLSINTIVILILAITMLGLGLMFIRHVFTTANVGVSGAQGGLTKETISGFKQSIISEGKILDLNMQQVEMKRGEKKQIYIGFRNDGAGDRFFNISSASVTSLSKTNNCMFVKNGLTQRVYLEYKDTPTKVLTGSVDVLPINIVADSDTNSDTCAYELEVKYGAGEASLTSNAKIELTVDVTI